ncbi:hypothetical protein ACMC56_16720 (plasmid) [Campylobacterota bacterium DY0563]
MRRWYERLAHFLAGIITAAASVQGWLLGLLLFSTFIIYELDEDLHLGDLAFVDIRDYALGLYTASLLLLLFR